MKLYVYDDYKLIFPQLQNSQLTDALIVKALVEHGYESSQVQVYRDENGKPFVKHTDGETIHVSCSHSASTFACLVADRNCGLDIQEKRETRMARISERYFSEDERAYVEANGIDGFYRIWTRREAYAKFTGVGLRQVMSDVSVLSRSDVIFEDSVLDNGMCCSICY